jgi:hypothetical protein
MRRVHQLAPELAESFLEQPDRYEAQSGHRLGQALGLVRARPAPSDRQLSGTSDE